MDFFDDWGKSLSNAFQRTVSGFKTVFTNPGKANLGDFVSVALPFWGGTIVNDIKNPKDAGYHALTLATLTGAAYGAQGLGLIAPKAAAAPKAGVLMNSEGYLVGDLTPRTVPVPQLSAEPGVFTAAVERAPTATELAAQRGLTGPASSPGLLDTVADSATSFTKATAKFVTKAAEISNAARTIASPWERAAASAAQALGFAPSAPAAGGMGVNVTAGGGSPVGPASKDAEAAPQQASMSGFLMLGLAVSAVCGLLYAMLRKKRP